jgi:hypothetical protein
MVRAVIPWEYPLDQLSLLNQNFRFDAVDCDIHSPVPRWSANTRAFSSDYQSSMDWRRRGKDRFSSTDSILLMSRAFGAYFALVGNLAGKLLRPAADETHSFARDTELLRCREDISLENARKSKTAWRSGVDSNSRFRLFSAKTAPRTSPYGHQSRRAGMMHQL